MRRDSPANAGFLTVVFATVAACFLAATAFAAWASRTIDRMADQIVHDAAPSIAHLATARSELHRLQDFVSDYVEDGRQPIAKAAINDSRARLEQETAAYVELPFTTGEHELWLAVAEDVRRVNEVVDDAIATADLGQMAAARNLVTVDLRQAVDAASAALAADLALNAGIANDAAQAIRARRRWTTRVAAIIDAFAVAITAYLALFVCRLNARHADLTREHTRFLEEKNSELELFASRMAHDVLSPLSSTRLAIDSVLRGACDENIARRLKAGRVGIDRSVKLAEELLSFARAGARPVSPGQANVRAVIAEVVEDLRPSAENASVRLDFDVTRDPEVACGRGLLVSVVSNLVNNAIKYMGKSAERIIRIRAHNVARRVLIEVEDTGPGLRAGTETSVFEPFVRGAGVTEAGLGLGLATVKRIVLAHGGAVGVESHEGSGSRFWVELPSPDRA